MWNANTIPTIQWEFNNFVCLFSLFHCYIEGKVLQVLPLPKPNTKSQEKVLYNYYEYTNLTLPTLHTLS